MTDINEIEVEYEEIKNKIMNDVELELLLSISNSFLGKSIKSKSRQREYVNARYVFCEIAKVFFEKGSSEIGRFIRFDHANIINYHNKFNGVYKTDSQVRKLYKDILQQLKESNPLLITLKFNQLNLRIKYHEEMINSLNEKKDQLLF